LSVEKKSKKVFMTAASSSWLLRALPGGGNRTPYARFSAEVSLFYTPTASG